ncbi:MAG: dialkylresorcinol condensing enzyme, partial [Sulfuricurvum sp.]|nr:dialkylresorcinol condensing enzyme [Sulfuricurvum sp.]
VLVVYYSQSGQLKNVLTAMLEPLVICDAVELTMLPLCPSEDFAFPWSFWNFFDAFPESVYCDALPNAPYELRDPENFDLIIVGYQPWFLSPSLPMSAFMKSDQAKIILNNKPVITVIACRNMWIEAQKSMKELLASCDARLIDNVVLSDQSGPLESFITTPRWMLTGKRNAFLGLSAAGISQDVIQKSTRFGEAIVKGLASNKEVENAPMLHGLGAVCVDPRFIASEKIGKRSFRIWGKLIRLFGKRGSWSRRPILGIYVLFLITLIVSVVPLNMALQSIIRRLFKGKMDKIIQSIEAPSGR